MGEKLQFYRVALIEGQIEVDVTRLDVALIDRKLQESSALSKERKKWLRNLFVDAVAKGRFKLMEGDIDAMGRHS